TTRTLTATIQDSAGNTTTTGADSTLSVSFAKTTGTGSVTGVGSVNAVAGVANITITGATAGSVTIGASGGSLAAGTGNPITFTVVANTTVDHFAFATISSPQMAGAAFNITITAQDAGNNTVTGYSGNGFKVKLTSTGTFSAITAITTAAFTNGVLTNHSVAITNSGTGYTLQATNAGLTSATSALFTINNPAPTLTSISPTSGNLSQTLDIVFNGTNYISGVTTVSFGTNITVNTVTVNSSTKL